MQLNPTRPSLGPEPRYPKVLGYPGPEQNKLICIAGPCSIESAEQIRSICRVVSQKGITYMRGGVYRAGTYPPDQPGLQMDLLIEWSNIAKDHGLKIIVELLDLRNLALIDPYVDAYQVGARHMQDYAMLMELARQKKPVTLKRHPGSNLNEFLGAAEYLCRGGNSPILIERGSSTFMDHVRWDLCVSLIAAVKEQTQLPILVDASHGSGRRDLVEPLTLAGIAAGADGFLVEVHQEPDKSISDAKQAYPLGDFGDLYQKVMELWCLKRNWAETC